MKSWAGAIRTRYYRTIEFDDGSLEASFDLKRVPVEFSQIKIWIPEYDPIKLSLEPGEKISVDLVRKERTRGRLLLERR